MNSIVCVLLLHLIFTLFIVQGDNEVKQRNPLAKKGEEDWGYIEVRPGARMFYWLYYSTGASDPSTLPLVMWLQGGPGASSTMFGNFELIGPLDKKQQPRNSTWVDHVNVLFIDNPVGSGYSYVNDTKLLTRNNKQISEDLITFTKSFYESHAEFETSPLLIFGESYGGKMGVDFALDLDKTIKAGEVKANLKTIAIGDGWVSPIDSTISWAPYLLATGMVDTEGFNQITESAEKCQQATVEGRWKDATNLWIRTTSKVINAANNVDFYNILEPKKPISKAEPAVRSIVDRFWMDKVDFSEDDFRTSNPIREKLLTRVPDLAEFGKQSDEVFISHGSDFMKPVTDSVELLLNTTDVKVVVYNGHLDLIVTTLGQVNWVERLKWPGKSNYMSANRKPVTIDGRVGGYLKQSERLSFWWINRAGHMVPADNPKMGIKLLRAVAGLPSIF